MASKKRKTKRQQKHKKADPHNAELIPKSRDNGTEQTQRQLKRGTLQYMIERGRISSNGPEMLAAEEIGRVYGYVVSEVSRAASWNLDRVDSGRPKTGEEPQWFVNAYTDRYLPWAREMNNVAFDVVINVVWERHTANTCDAWYKWRKGTSTDVLIWGLRRYALKAGWVSGRVAQTWSAEIYA